MREFETGATRDSDDDKLDFEGFLSPLVLHRFATYMHKNRVQADGALRASDNWQKGIPQDTYMKSMWRHFFDVWHAHRYETPCEKVEEALCALMFNVQGYLFELLMQKKFPMLRVVVEGEPDRVLKEVSDLLEKYHKEIRKDDEHPTE